MTVPEICNLLIQAENKQPVYELAILLASLDTQTALDLIAKYTKDTQMTQKQLSDEIASQTLNKAWRTHEF